MLNTVYIHYLNTCMDTNGISKLILLHVPIMFLYNSKGVWKGSFSFNLKPIQILKIPIIENWISDHVSSTHSRQYNAIQFSTVLLK